MDLLRIAARVAVRTAGEADPGEWKAVLAEFGLA